MRELQAVQYNSDLYSDQNLLYKSGLVDTPTLSKNLTYLWGKDSDIFPLLTMTQGQNAIRTVKVELDDTQYTWPTMGRRKVTTKLIGLVNTNLTQPGIGCSFFDIYVEDNTVHAQYSIISPNRKNILRFMTEPRKLADKKYVVTVQLITGDLNEYVTSDQLIAGRSWAMGATSVAASLSDGTASNRMFPGKLTNQFGFQRYSQIIAGNISNKVVPYELDLAGGGKTNFWMPFEMKQWEVESRMLDEVDLWISKYNRDAAGNITMRDLETNEPIPKGAGVVEQIKAAGNYDTFSVLTKTKFDNTVRAVFGNRTDDGPMEIILYTGQGGAQMFHDMVMSEASGYIQALADKVIGGKDGYLSYGAYFNQYRTIDGKLITIRTSKFFDQGPFAQADRENGRMYNGLPFYSYNMAFLDHSADAGGERNIVLVYEKGREELTGVYLGLTNVPDAWIPVTKRQLSTTKDKASYERMISRGICIKNATTCFMLEMEAA